MLTLSRAGSQRLSGIIPPIRTLKTLVYQQNGQPEELLELQDQPNREPGPNEALVEWLAAPINPADINQIQGTYGIRPSLPAVPGNEGVGIVKTLGQKGSEKLKPGDWVVPLQPGLGTWREASCHDSAVLHPIPSKLPLGVAATLAINPPTAKRLLNVVDLKAGDVVIQNGANSFVGQYIIRTAARRGIRTINVVRDRPQLQELKAILKSMGADLVSTEDSLREDMKASGLPKPQLAVNCVGGKSSTLLARSLGKGGTIVTYGGLSKQPVILPTGQFIFKGLRAQGFWLSGGSRTDAEAAADIDEAVQLWKEDPNTCTGFSLFALTAFKDALTEPKSDLLARKTLLATEKGMKIASEQDFVY